MARGSSGFGSVPHGSTAFSEALSGSGATEFGGSGALEVGAAPDTSVEPFELLRRTKPFDMLRRTKPFEMSRR